MSLQLGCNEVACLTEIAMAANVDRIIGGTISRVEGATLLTLQLINARYATMENRVILKWQGELSTLPLVR